MSPTLISPSCAALRALMLVLTLITAFVSNASTAAAPLGLPKPLVNEVAGAEALTVRGTAVMRFVGLKVYDIALWTPSQPLRDDQLFALQLVYDLGLKGAEIAKRSVVEMRKVGYTDEAKLTRWGETMTRIFPDVKKGEVLVGVYVPTPSGAEARFYSSTRLLDTVKDAEFAKAFFDIWLSEKTSEPKLRTRLLGNK
jgi:hypothetical protein